MQTSQETGKVVWYSHLFNNFPRFVVIHTVKGFSIANEVEVDVFLEFSWFFYDPMDVSNLISGSSAFSKSSLYIWKFSVHVCILLNPSLKDFEHYLALENHRDGGAWWATIYGVSQSRTQLKQLSSSSSCCFNNVGLVSAVPWSESAICIHISPLSHILPL